MKDLTFFPCKIRHFWSINLRLYFCKLLNFFLTIVQISCNKALTFYPWSCKLLMFLYNFFFIAIQVYAHKFDFYPIISWLYSHKLVTVLCIIVQLFSHKYTYLFLWNSDFLFFFSKWFFFSRKLLIFPPHLYTLTSFVVWTGFIWQHMKSGELQMEIQRERKRSGAWELFWQIHVHQHFWHAGNATVTQEQPGGLDHSINESRDRSTSISRPLICWRAEY